MRRPARIVVAVVLVIFAAASIAGGVLIWGLSAFAAHGPLTGPATVVIAKGSGLAGIALQLEASGIIRSGRVFVWAARLTGGARALRAGEYAFSARASMEAVLETLVAGRTVLRRLTVPEGLTARQIVALVEGAGGLEGSVAPLPKEGSLLPETYHYAYGDPRGTLVERMRRDMDRAVAKLWAERAEGLPFDRPEDAVILASVVEKETALPAERSRIAAVFINRLKKGMRLQSDPTVVYALTGGRGALGRQLTRADLDADHPYNTYRNAGLPPGPICNPGRESLGAVLHPAKTEDIYFVADGSGGHVFAKTLAEHNRNVAKWRKVKRGGMSK